MFAYLSLTGWPGIYSICISQLVGVFPAFIVTGLIRDNEGAVYRELSYFPHL